MSQSEMPEHTRRILDEAAQQLRHTQLSGPSKLFATAVLSSLKALRGRTDVLAKVQRLQREASGISEVLARCAEELGEAERAEAARLPEGEDWWKRRRRAVSSAFHAKTPDAESLWVSTWVDVLAREAWPWCMEMATLRQWPERLQPTATAMESITESLKAGDPAAARCPLEDLLAQGVGGLDAETRIGLLLVRILLTHFSDRALVRDVAVRTVERARGTRQEPLALAARAEVELANDGSSVAEATLSEAVSRSTPAAVDALVMLGELHDSEAAWVEADRRYDQALRLDPFAARPALLRRVPARLLVRAAGQTHDPRQAVTLLEQALKLGVPGDGDYADRDVWVSKGDLLLQRASEEGAEEASETRRQAAQAYYEGGLRYSWSGYVPRALELFEKASAVDPDVALYPWQRAEALRWSAYDTDGVVNRQRLTRAQELLEVGFERCPTPEPGEAWVFATQSKIAEGLGETGARVALPLERAVLLDPDYGLGFVFLAAALRREGWVSEAEEAMQQAGDQVVKTDAFAFGIQLGLCLDREDYAGALRLLDERAMVSYEDADQARQRACVLILQGQAEDALRILQQDGSEMGRLYSGLAKAALAGTERAWARRARDEFESLWLDTRSAATGEIAGYAAYGAGLIEEGIALYTGLAARAAADQPYQRDLGQMLLAVGSVDAGRAELEQGIDSCPYAAELGLLAAAEFPLLWSLVEDKPHAMEVRTTLDELERRIAGRVADLRSQRREPGSVAVMAATARTALHERRPLGALHIYRVLVGSPELPEAAAGAAIAAVDARREADEAFVAGEHGRARTSWAEVEESVTGVPGCEEVARSLRARGLITDLMDDDDGWRVEQWLDPALDGDDERIGAALAEAVDALVTEPERLWVLRDGLARLQDQPGVRSSVRRAVTELVAGLPVSRAYALDSHEAVTYPTFLSVRQLEMFLGTEAATRLDDHIDPAVEEMVRRLQEELGVLVPAVYHALRSNLEPHEVVFEVYGRWVGRTLLEGDPGGWLGQVTDALERVVRDHLFRMVGVDDVDFWLEGWDLEHGDTPEWQPNDPVADRLRLARVLRMLLREGASVAHREAILAGLDATGSPDRGREATTLDTLRDVRLRLGRESLGWRSGSEVATLPPALAERLEAGLADGRPVWELKRTEAFRLTADLRSWMEGSTRRPDVLVVDDRVRPFLWRLVADQQVVVLSNEELGDD